MICERCSNQTYMLEKCNYCGKNICTLCVKSGKRLKKIRRLVICNDCWGKLPKRKIFKSA